MHFSVCIAFTTPDPPPQDLWPRVRGTDGRLFTQPGPGHSRPEAFVGLGRGADFLFYLSLLVLVFIAFAYYLKFRQIELRWPAIVRHLAISEARDGGSQSWDADTPRA